MGELRYGENPHQRASAYQFKHKKQQAFCRAIQHQGKPLSYNNILDAEAAFNCVSEFQEPACVIVKHANPCGAASAETMDEAYSRAYQADPQSAFGGIIALNRDHVRRAIAEAMIAIFMEVVIAPSYSQDALQVFAAKPNLRVLELAVQNVSILGNEIYYRWCVDARKRHANNSFEDLKIVTQVAPTSEEIASMMFAWRILKHIKSNGILIAKNNTTIGIGAGQVSRIDAVDLAIRKAAFPLKTRKTFCSDASHEIPIAKGSSEMTGHLVLASDAFFPFRDSIDKLANTGVSAIIQPGGSVRDEEVIAACDEHGMAMVFTGKRCFRH